MHRRLLLAAVMSVGLTGTAFAQTARPPVVVSPEVMSDRRVTFRIYAPKASEILLTGDWMGPRDQPVSLVKGEDGVWTAVAGPHEPNVYSYGFIVDGIRTIDPSNRRSGLSERFPFSLVEVNGPAQLPWERRSVPKGSVHRETFLSGLQQRERSYYVYTPPGYHDSPSSRTYPTVVLLPGAPGTESDWVTGGLVDRVFDNLLAEGKIKEALVVMPRSDVLLQPGTRADNLRQFEPLLLTEVLPHFEKRYRATPRPDSRAIAGYSLGGELALSVGLGHPEIFGAVGSFGGSLFERDFEQRFGRVLADPASANRYRVIWIGCGTGDLLLPGSEQLSALFTTKHIKHTLRVLPGGFHSTATFRVLLTEFVPTLFR